MAWVRAQFKGKSVWAEIGAAGVVVEQGGRTPIRYSDKAGATIYRAGMRAVEVTDRSPRDLPAGASADDKKKKTSSKRGSGFGSAGTRTKAQADAALLDAKARIAALPEGTIVAFTDGACQGNPGPAGAGAVVTLADGTKLEAWRALGIATNNVGELTAVGMAIDLLEEAGVESDAAVSLFTDSKYTKGVLAQGWKAKANRELIGDIRERLQGWPNFTIEWVAGHVGVAENERADELAGRGCRESM